MFSNFSNYRDSIAKAIARSLFQGKVRSAYLIAPIVKPEMKRSTKKL